MSRHDPGGSSSPAPTSCPRRGGRVHAELTPPGHIHYAFTFCDMRSWRGPWLPRPEGPDEAGSKVMRFGRHRGERMRGLPSDSLTGLRDEPGLRPTSRRRAATILDARDAARRAP